MFLILGFISLVFVELTWRLFSLFLLHQSALNKWVILPLFSCVLFCTKKIISSDGLKYEIMDNFCKLNKITVVWYILLKIKKGKFTQLPLWPWKSQAVHFRWTLVNLSFGPGDPRFSIRNRTSSCCLFVGWFCYSGRLLFIKTLSLHGFHLLCVHVWRIPASIRRKQLRLIWSVTNVLNFLEMNSVTFHSINIMSASSSKPPMTLPIRIQSEMGIARPFSTSNTVWKDKMLRKR